MFLIGDLHTPGIDWETLTGTSPITNSICNLCNEFNLIQMNTIPSRVSNDNILDVILSNKNNSINNIEMEPPIFNSDHHLLKFTMITTPDSKAQGKRWVYNFKDVNYDEINFRIDELNLTDLIQQCGDNIDLAWELWLYSIQQLINNHIPKREIRIKTSPWIDGDCLHLIHLKKQAWNKAKRTNTEDDWKKYKDANNLCKNTINRKQLFTICGISI